MAMFRKKPVEVEAVRYVGLGHVGEPVFEGMPPWLQHARDKAGTKVGAVCVAANGHPWINTLEGGHIASPGDWIIQDVQGELYPCNPDIFAATYEPVETPDVQP